MTLSRIIEIINDNSIPLDVNILCDSVMGDGIDPINCQGMFYDSGSNSLILTKTPHIFRGATSYIIIDGQYTPVSGLLDLSW